MPTARDIIKGSLRLIGVLQSGEEPAAEDAADALVRFNEMLGSWALDNLLVFDRQELSYVLTPGTAAYTIGPTGTLSTPIRPIRLQWAFVRSGTVDFPLDIITEEQYSQIVLKTVSNPWPSYIRFDASFPNATVTFYETPSAPSTVFMTFDIPFATATSLSTVFTSPPGYDEAMRYGLAARLAPEFGTTLDPNVLAGAVASLAALKRNNITPLLMSIDGRLPRRGGNTSAAFYLRGE